MTAWSKHLPGRSDTTRGVRGLSQAQSIALLATLLIAVVVVAFMFQHWVEKDLHLAPPIASTAREQCEITKLAAEIPQIRSDTAGSLFWLKTVALFVTVGGAIGGYLVGQQRTTKSRLDFERRKRWTEPISRSFKNWRASPHCYRGSSGQTRQYSA
jgi:hypothetical protein